MKQLTMFTGKSVVTGLKYEEEVFVHMIVDGIHQNQAFFDSHKMEDKKTTNKNIMNRASKLINNNAVKQRIESLKKEMEERYKINRDYIVDSLKTIVDVGIERPIEGAAVIDSMGANSALDKLTKIAGLYAPDKSQQAVVTHGKFVLNLKQD